MPQSLTVKLDLYAAADFVVSVPDRRITVVAGTSAGYGVSIERLNSYAHDVNMTCSGLPTGATSSYNDSELSVGEVATLTIGTAGVAAGTYTLSATGAEAPAEGNVVYAASPSLADVQAAIALASPGDTVRVPAGSATWVASSDGGIMNWQANLIIQRGIKLIGAGIGQTNITFSAPCGIAYAPSSAAYAANDSFRLSGFTFDHSGNSTWGSSGNAQDIFLFGRYYNGSLTRNRIDHCRFYKTGQTFWVTGPIWGVADHCAFEYTSNSYSSYIIPVRGTGGDRDMWDNFPASFGTANNFHLEDCTISGSFWFEGGQGGRYCARHNAFDGTSEFDMFDAHGNQSAGANYATMMVEIYDNVFTNNTKATRLIAMRGGKVLVYNNALSGVAGVSGAVLNSYEEFSDYDSPVNDPSVSIQHPNNCYLFNNTKNASKFTDVSITGTVDYTSIGEPYRVVPQKDKDIWWEQAASFDGSTGVGVGLLSARPASCSLTGAGYWATDTKTLYRWTGSAWATYYAPYAYPHPLRSDSQLGD